MSSDLIYLYLNTKEMQSGVRVRNRPEVGYQRLHHKPQQAPTAAHASPPQTQPAAARSQHHRLPHPAGRRKTHQSHGVRRESPERARREPPPEPPPTAFGVHGPGGVGPAAESAARRVERIRHDALLDDVGGVAGQPVDLGGEAASPEVDGGGGEAGAGLQGAGEEVVGAPPEEEERAEEEGGGQAVVEAGEAVRAELWVARVSSLAARWRRWIWLLGAVDWEGSDEGEGRVRASWCSLSDRCIAVPISPRRTGSAGAP